MEICKIQNNIDNANAEKQLLLSIKIYLDTYFESKGIGVKTVAIDAKNKYYTVAEAAKIMNVSTSTLYGYISKKLIAYFKPHNGKVYLTQEAIDDFILSETGHYKALRTIEKQAVTDYHINKI